MVREPRRFRPLHQLLQPPQVLAVGLLRRAEIHRDAMLHYFVLLEDLIQNVQRPSAVDHEIFGDDFKPVDNRLAGEDVIIVRRPQADTNSIIRKPIKFIFSHASLQATKMREGRNYRPPPRREASNHELPGRTAFSRRQSGSHPCPCRSVCPSIRCPRTRTRPCPCQSFRPSTRVSPFFPFLSPPSAPSSPPHP